MSTISALCIVTIVSSVSSQFFTGLDLNELIPNYQSRPYYHRDNIVQSSPCPNVFQYTKLNNEIQGLLTVQCEVESKIHLQITLSVAVELFSVSFNTK